VSINERPINKRDNEERRQLFHTPPMGVHFTADGNLRLTASIQYRKPSMQMMMERSITLAECADANLFPSSADVGDVVFIGP